MHELPVGGPQEPGGEEGDAVVSLELDTAALAATHRSLNLSMHLHLTCLYRVGRESKSPSSQ